MVEHVSYMRSFCKTAVQEPFWFFPLKDCPDARRHTYFTFPPSQNNAWIDYQTRFVAIQLLVWRGTSQMYTYSVFFLEFTAAGGMYTDFREFPFSVSFPSPEGCESWGNASG